MAIDVPSIKTLRERTAAGVMDCKKALEKNNGDIEKAVEYLRIKGLAQAARKAGRITSEGLVEAYIHPGGKIGVLIEVNCETDFVARTDDFKVLVRDLSMQVAASSPLYISKDDVPPSVIEKLIEEYKSQARQEGKQEKVLDRIAQGRMEKYYSEVCLLEQGFIRDPDIQVSQRIASTVSRLGENIRVKRFMRYQLGEEASKDPATS